MSPQGTGPRPPRRRTVPLVPPSAPMAVPETWAEFRHAFPAWMARVDRSLALISAGALADHRGLTAGGGVYAPRVQPPLEVTDEGIIRHSHWGNQDLHWKDVVAFERHPILFSETQVGRIAGLSHVLHDRKIIAKLPTFCYELRTAPGASSQGDGVMRLEPGTIDDLAWLIEIISERIGPPLDV